MDQLTMKQRIASFDWSATPLGPMAGWPQSLRSTVTTLLASRYPMILLWGPELIQIYNDAYSELLGDKHPAALGIDVRITLAEGWDTLRPVVEEAMTTGRPSWVPALLLPLDRAGYREEAYFSVSHGPVEDDQGRIAGMLGVCSEVTQQILGERRLRLLRDLAARTDQARRGEAVCRDLAAAMAGHPLDIPFARIYLRQPDGSLAPCGDSGPAEGDAAWPLARAASGETVLAEGVERHLAAAGGPWGEPVRSALVMPLAAAGSAEPFGVLVAGVSPNRALDEGYSSFYELAAAQVSLALRSARAYEDPGLAAPPREQREMAQLREETAEARSEMEMAERLLERERAARAEAERVNRLKDEFLSTVSHELRTPLNAILGWAQLLRQPGVDAARLVEGIAVIERNARSQAKLTEDLLDLGRIVSGKVRLDLQPTDLVAVVREAVETLQPTAELKKVRLDRNLELEAGLAAADPNRLHQVIANLLSNAIKFTPKGGRVLVTLKRVASSYEIAVSDTGVGIDPDFLPHLFERFRQADGSTTRRYGGLGIGLSIVKSLVELHGGTIKARSEGRNRGATFVVTLPVAALRGGEPEAAARPASEIPPPLAGVKVLVVDDEPVAREVVRQALQSRGAQVVTAGSGEEALRFFPEIRPDILVSDIGMPVVDGCELLRRVRSLGPVGAIPAVALTATAEVEDCPGLLLAGYQACLAKPVDPAELVSTVAGLVGIQGLAFS